MKTLITTLSILGLLTSCSSSDHTLKTSRFETPQVMKYGLHQFLTMDTTQMVKLVDRQMQDIIKQDYDNDTFLQHSADVLARYVLPQIQFDARESAMRKIRSEIEPEDFVRVMKLAAQQLLPPANSENSVDQATALVALTNLVTEMRSMRRPDFKPDLKIIANTDFELRNRAKQYLEDIGKKLVLPSVEATETLRIMETRKNSD